MSSRECFCGCGATVVSGNQFAGNLLGWDLTGELAEWMKVTVVLAIAAPDRDRSNEENFIGDGRSIWLSLRDQVHQGLPQDRQQRKLTKRWLKFSKKERVKLQRRLEEGGPGGPPPGTSFDAEEVRLWLLEDQWPEWVSELRQRYQEKAAARSESRPET